jgi:hypothetical protein
VSSNLTVSATGVKALFPDWHADCESRNMNDQESEPTRIAFHEFALACRAERDRIANALLAEEDRRFEAAPVERAEANQQAAHFIAAMSR